MPHCSRRCPLHHLGEDLRHSQHYPKFKKHKALQAMAREGHAFLELKSSWALQWAFQFYGIFIHVK